MNIEIKAPSPGESISQVLLASWLVEDTTWVEQNAEIAEIESDKATLMVFSSSAGIIHISVEAGQTIDVGATIAIIDTSADQQKSKKNNKKEKSNIQKETISSGSLHDNTAGNFHITPLAMRIADDKGITKEQLKQLKKERIRRDDIYKIKDGKQPIQITGVERPHERIKMSPLRKKLAERLVSVKNETAMLTTFNEVNMNSVLAIREKNNADFSKKFGHNIGLISFFVKAASMAFDDFPKINASIDGEDIVQYQYADICIAVSTPKGLLTPAIRDVQNMCLTEIEQKIRDFGIRSKENKITLNELTGGTFTITNGGTFGSMMSTPIINPPQSAILGLHKVYDRPIAVNGAIEINPMMYIALSYDHRLIDGKESVGFIVKVKNLVENPLLMSKNGTIEELLSL